MPFLWGFYDGERYRAFPDAETLIRWLAPQNVICYAHNGGKFDYTYLFPYLDPYTEVLIINGRLAKFTIGNCEFRDSWNILPVPLREFGKLEIDFAKLEPDVRHLHMAEIERYNAVDCRSLWDSVTTFVSMYGSHMTLASSAMAYWSKVLGHEKPESDAAFYHRIKPYYSGGRVQCFHKGLIDKPFHVVDINSAYPHAMTHRHPYSVREDDVEHPSIKEPIIPQSLYHIEGEGRSGLPWKSESGELSFPDGEGLRDFKITGWELQAAIETDAIHNWRIVNRKDFLKEIDFNDYVDHFYALKAAAPKGSIEYILAKLMQNSLYGKFGANPENYCSYGIVPMTDKAITGYILDASKSLGRNSGPWDWGGSLGPWALMKGQDPKSKKPNLVRSQYYNAATAASITGFVRAHLWKAIYRVRAAGGEVLYCDTDSIVYHLDKPKERHPFSFSKKLGDWTYEGSFSHGGIAGKKMYAFHMDEKTYAESCQSADKAGKEKPLPWKCAHKGVKLSAEDIITVASGGEVKWESEAPSKSPFTKVKKGERQAPAKFHSRLVRMT